jgi:shikimate kinase
VIVKRHIVLIGLPGSGKSAVGRLVAERLQAGFVDIDAIVERREGRPISMIFAEKGEAAFREMERKEVEVALAGEPAVIAPGGGWAAQAGAIDAAKLRALVIYLHTRPETAAQRAAPQGTRPALMGGDPVERMRLLQKEREEFYRGAHAQVETDRKSPPEVANEVVRLAQSSAGW